MQPRVLDWVIDDHVGACLNPTVSDEAMAELRSVGVGLLINLHERPDPAGLLQELRAKALYLPVPNSNAPTQEQLECGVAAIDDAVRRGERVVVHCGAGLGRAGTLLAAYMVSVGAEAQEAIARVRAARPGSVETLEQERAVHEFQRRKSAGSR